MSKKIVVFTVTGDQGGSVARYLLKDGGYEVVGVVRDPSSDKSKGTCAWCKPLPRGVLV